MKNQVPEWLNEEFLKRAIRSYKSDDTVEIVKFNAMSAFGEHYASKMYRASVEFKSIKFPHHDNEVLSVVIKAQPINDVILQSIVAEGPLFENEIEMLQKVIPAMHQVYQRNGIDVKFAPELIYAISEPFSIIVLKDLTPDDYKVRRIPPDNIEESKKLIKRLAQFHAASIYLNESNEVDFSNFKYSIYESKYIVDFFLRDTIKAFREVVAEWGEEFEDYVPKVEKLIKDIEVIGKKSYTANSKGCGFNVLNHGDLHLRNILIKDDSEQRMESFYFVDYQLSVWCSAVVDLTYMMGLVKFDESSSDEVKDELIVFYHQQLVTALKSIGYMKAPPTLLDLNVELLKHGAMNIAVWINFFPFLFIDWSKMNTDDLIGQNDEQGRNFKKNLFKSPVLKSLLKKEMRKWALKGWW
ncbi:hypothetical protein PVAND_004443 [Polypedilum vanderplanki]|uniref:CHK kinase-like domain-containing protein n=1 Tax=Polypedilum vanderplanki TaxID=319348 RepID=A0A9J6BXK6_POLVA|nr:hypothetical protein PVAND_004443 [Polypedilum vanderplanki]